MHLPDESNHVWCIINVDGVINGGILNLLGNNHISDNYEDNREEERDKDFNEGLNIVPSLNFVVLP